jgi:gamma-D-glutamyl-L-lysine dipeptidyl-peptidase
LKTATTELAAIPMRKEPSDRSEMINQVIFGETMDILDENEKWYMVRLHHDAYEGWVDKKQLIEATNFNSENTVIATNSFFAAIDVNKMVRFLPAGSRLWDIKGENFRVGEKSFTLTDKGAIENQIIPQTLASLMFVGTPYLWGGRTFMGMDCSGFTQIACRLCGKWIPRDAWQQAEEGELVPFLDDARTGDLAFFDNAEGRITHVGLILSSEDKNIKTIVHSSGQVRMDLIDHEGIYNLETKSYSHKLRLIRRF